MGSLWACLSPAQQDQHFTHFALVPQAYNPAFVGSKPMSICVNAITHHQWKQFHDRTPLPGQTRTEDHILQRDVAPVTQNINVFGPLRIDDRWSEKWFAGLSVINDQISSFGHTSVHFKFAGRGYISHNAALIFGANVGMEQTRLDGPKFIARQIPDPILNNLPAKMADSKMDAGVGVLLQQRRWRSFFNNHIGASVLHLPQNSYDLQAFDMDQALHFYANAGTRLRINHRLRLQSSILFKHAVASQIDLNNTFIVDRQYSLGIGYRRWRASDSFGLLGGYSWGPFRLGYSYDITRSNIRLVSRGTHEVFFSYCIPVSNHWHRNTRWL